MPNNSTIDTLWFQSRPDRQYRLRRQTQAEVAEWRVAPREGHRAWCVIRRSDGALEAVALREGQTMCDCEGCAEQFFDNLHGVAA